MKLLGSILIALAALFCYKKQETITTKALAPAVLQPTVPVDTSLTYLALGDSYTIGQSVPYTQSFPLQLASQLRNSKYNVTAPTVIARTGWTTTDLKRAIADSAITKKFSFVTLLIGVNNQFQHKDIDSYKTDFDELVSTAILYANGNQKRVFVLSIPDYSVTPFAANSDTTTIRAEIDRYNAIKESESKRLGVHYLNITDISRQAKTNNSLLADDGLHPSGIMYKMWVDLLRKQVISSF